MGRYLKVQCCGCHYLSKRMNLRHRASRRAQIARLRLYKFLRLTFTVFRSSIQCKSPEVGTGWCVSGYLDIASLPSLRALTQFCYHQLPSVTTTHASLTDDHPAARPTSRSRYLSG